MNKTIVIYDSTDNNEFKQFKFAMDTPTRFNSEFETMEYDSQTKKMLIDYMESFQPNSAGGYIDDCHTGESTDIPCVGYEDGEYCWSNQSIYHLNKYNAKVFPEFISHVKIMNEYSNYRIALLYLLDLIDDFSISNTQNFPDKFKEEFIQIIDNCQKKMDIYAPNDFDWFDEESNEIRMKIAKEYAPLIIEINEKAINDLKIDSENHDKGMSW